MLSKENKTTNKTLWFHAERQTYFKSEEELRVYDPNLQLRYNEGFYGDRYLVWPG